MEVWRPWPDELPEWAIDDIQRMTPAERVQLGIRFTQARWKQIAKLSDEGRPGILDAEGEPWNWPSRPDGGTSA